MHISLRIARLIKAYKILLKTTSIECKISKKKLKR